MSHVTGQAPRPGKDNDDDSSSMFQLREGLASPRVSSRQEGKVLLWARVSNPGKKKPAAATGAPPPRPTPPKRTPPPRPKQEVIEDFEEVVDDFDELGGLDDYDDYEDDHAPMPGRRRGGRSGGGRSGGRRPAKKGGGVWGFITGENRLLQALADHEAETGDRYELIKAGIPPLRLWIKNRKGDKWGLVRDDRGRELWVRYRVRIFTSGPPLAFFD